MFERIFLGLLIIAVGFFMSWKTEFFYDILGPVDWADRTIGGGGSRVFYKLVGVAIIVLGCIVATNLFEELVGGFITSLFAR